MVLTGSGLFSLVCQVQRQYQLELQYSGGLFSCVLLSERWGCIAGFILCTQVFSYVQIESFVCQICLSFSEYKQFPVEAFIWCCWGSRAFSVWVGGCHCFSLYSEANLLKTMPGDVSWCQLTVLCGVHPLHLRPKGIEAVWTMTFSPWKLWARSMWAELSLPLKIVIGRAL